MVPNLEELGIVRWVRKQLISKGDNGSAEACLLVHSKSCCLALVRFVNAWLSLLNQLIATWCTGVCHYRSGEWETTWKKNLEKEELENREQVEQCSHGEVQGPL